MKMEHKRSNISVLPILSLQNENCLISENAMSSTTSWRRLHNSKKAFSIHAMELKRSTIRLLANQINNSAVSFSSSHLAAVLVMVISNRFRSSGICSEVLHFLLIQIHVFESCPIFILFLIKCTQFIIHH